MARRCGHVGDYARREATRRLALAVNRVYRVLVVVHLALVRGQLILWNALLRHLLIGVRGRPRRLPLLITSSCSSLRLLDWHLSQQKATSWISPRLHAEGRSRALCLLVFVTRDRHLLIQLGICFLELAHVLLEELANFRLVLLVQLLVPLEAVCAAAEHVRRPCGSIALQRVASARSRRHGCGLLLVGHFHFLGLAHGTVRLLADHALTDREVPDAVDLIAGRVTFAAVLSHQALPVGNGFIVSVGVGCGHDASRHALAVASHG